MLSAGFIIDGHNQCGVDDVISLDPIFIVHSDQRESWEAIEGRGYLRISKLSLAPNHDRDRLTRCTLQDMKYG